MQAIMVGEFGGPEALRAGEAAGPGPRAGEVLVRVVAAGVGPWDAWLRRAGWTGSLPDVPGRGAERVLACAARTLDGAARAARAGALIATPVHAELPGAERVGWQRYDGQPRGSRLIRMAPWFDDGSLSVTVQARYYWHNAAQAHRVMEEGHTRGKLVLIVDDDLAASLEV